jgi:hypothetical protein
MTTEAGKRLLQSDVATTGWSGGVVNDFLARAVEDIEAEAREGYEATLKARGWWDEYEVETNLAVNYGEGMAEGAKVAEARLRVAEARLRERQERRIRNLYIERGENRYVPMADVLHALASPEADDV